MDYRSWTWCGFASVLLAGCLGNADVGGSSGSGSNSRGTESDSDTESGSATESDSESNTRGDADGSATTTDTEGTADASASATESESATASATESDSESDSDTDSASSSGSDGSSSSTGGGPSWCDPLELDIDCVLCAKEMCCPEVEACLTDVTCICLVQCLQVDLDFEGCATQCGQSQASMDVRVCAQGSCVACNEASGSSSGG